MGGAGGDAAARAGTADSRIEGGGGSGGRDGWWREEVAACERTLAGAATAACERTLAGAAAAAAAAGLERGDRKSVV